MKHVFRIFFSSKRVENETKKTGENLKDYWWRIILFSF